MSDLKQGPAVDWVEGAPQVFGVYDRGDAVLVSAQVEFRADNGLRQGLAALCLHDQPFGFTAHDVETLRHSVDDLERAGSFAFAFVLGTIADRIAALLPPEGVWATYRDGGWDFDQTATLSNGDELDAPPAIAKEGDRVYLRITRSGK